MLGGGVSGGVWAGRPWGPEGAELQGHWEGPGVTRARAGTEGGRVETQAEGRVRDAGSPGSLLVKFKFCERHFTKRANEQVAQKVTNSVWGWGADES